MASSKTTLGSAAAWISGVSAGIGALGRGGGAFGGAFRGAEVELGAAVAVSFAPGVTATGMTSVDGVGGAADSKAVVSGGSGVSPAAEATSWLILASATTSPAMTTRSPTPE